MVDYSFKGSFSDNMGEKWLWKVKLCPFEVHGNVDLQKNSLSTFFSLMKLSKFLYLKLETHSPTDINPWPYLSSQVIKSAKWEWHYLFPLFGPKEHDHFWPFFIVQSQGIEQSKTIILFWRFYGVSTIWHFRLWSFQGRDTKLERFLAKNQLYSNEITKFWELE